MPLTLDERDVVTHWAAHLQAARERAAQLAAYGLPLPDLRGDAALQSLATWLSSSSSDTIGMELREAQHSLVNAVSGLMGARLLEGRNGCPSLDATLALWEAAIAALVAKVPPAATIDRFNDDLPAGRQPARVLCVEDDPVWQSQTLDVLKGALAWLPPSRITLAATGADARAFVVDHRGSERRDEEVLVILDLGIPERAGENPSRRHGLALLEYIRREMPRWSAIIWSVATDSIDDHRVAARHGVSDFLLKTSPSTRLAGAIRRAVASEPYALAFTSSEEAVIIDGRECSVSAQQRGHLWDMAMEGGWKTAVEWERVLGLPHNGFAGFLNELQPRLSQELARHNIRLDWPRLVATRPIDPDTVGGTLEYRLLPLWREIDSSQTLDARRTFRVLAGAGTESRTRPLRVLVVDDKSIWHKRVVTLLRKVSYMATAATFREAPPAGHYDAVCLDLIDAADPADSEAAGRRWLRAHGAALRGTKVVILSSMAHRDPLRTGILSDFDVRLSDFVLKDESDEPEEGTGPKEWRFQLLRALYQIERERIVGVGLAPLGDDVWPPTFERGPNGWDLVTGDRRAPIFRGAGYRFKLLERLAARPFLPVPWRTLHSAMYSDSNSSQASVDPKEALRQVVKNCRIEVQRLIGREAIYPIDVATFIEWADDGYVLNARVVRSQD